MPGGKLDPKTNEGFHLTSFCRGRKRDWKPTVVTGTSQDILPETSVHRIGGGSLDNLQLSSLDKQLSPVGISVLLGGSPQEAARAMRQAFSKSKKWREASKTVGTTTAEALRQAGFEIVPDATERFPNHARLIHPDDVAGFTETNLERLAQTFQDTQGC